VRGVLSQPAGRVNTQFDTNLIRPKKVPKAEAQRDPADVIGSKSNRPVQRLREHPVARSRQTSKAAAIPMRIIACPPQYSPHRIRA
jgi:hypothetical protein